MECSSRLPLLVDAGGTPQRLVCSSCDLPFFALLFTHRLRGRSIIGQERVAESRKGPRVNRGTYLARQAQHVTYIMYTAQAKVKLLFSAREMVNISGAVVPARIAIAFRLDGAALDPETRRSDIHAPITRKKSAVAGNPRGQCAIKHVHAQTDRRHEVLGRTDTQQVSRLVLLQFGRDMAEHLPQHSFRFAHKEPTNRNPRERPVADDGRAGPAPFRLERSLHNPKNGLLRSIAILSCKGALGPAVGALHPLPRLCRW